MPPSEALLEWLIENPGELTWPKRRGQPIEYEAPTMDARRRLIYLAGTPEGEQAKRDALSALAARGAARSRRQWWAFEGFTHVDAVIATSKLVLLVEGKRTDALSSRTDWLTRRGQLARNLEAAGVVAGGRHSFVMSCDVKPLRMAGHPAAY